MSRKDNAAPGTVPAQRQNTDVADAASGLLGELRNIARGPRHYRKILMDAAEVLQVEGHAVVEGISKTRGKTGVCALCLGTGIGVGTTSPPCGGCTGRGLA